LGLIGGFVKYEFRAVEIANRLETGTVWIKDNLQNAPHIPVAGSKQSGLGVENGKDGLREYIWPRTVFIPKQKVG
jgi:acyl-CoA reductase-like NAD-dependent aldehyde dehydrogenase